MPLKQAKKQCKAEVYFSWMTLLNSAASIFQLYTIHVDIGSSNHETAVIPAIYSLIFNKITATYERFLKKVEEQVPHWKPTVFKVDFEETAIKALHSQIFGVKICGCNFHFNQCLWRKVQNFGLVENYTKDENVRLHARMCASLAYLSVNGVEDGWLTSSLRNRQVHLGQIQELAATVLV